MCKLCSGYGVMPAHNTLNGRPMIHSNFNRRAFLKSLAASGVGLAFGMTGAVKTRAASSPYLVKAIGSFKKSVTEDLAYVRALALEPKIKFMSKKGRVLRVVLDNVWADRLQVYGPSIEGMDVSGRTIRADVYLPAGEEVLLETRLNPLPGETLNFAAISDTHLGVPEAEEHFDKIQKQVNKRKPLFIVDAGDIIDFDDMKQWKIFEEKESLFKIPFYSTIGNHDSYISTKLYEQFLGDLFHGFTFNGTQFLFLDNAQRYNDATLVMDSAKPMEQWEWLERSLAEQAKRRFAFFHFPVFGDRSMLDQMYVKNSNMETRISEVNKMVDLFKTSGLGYVSFGHLHSPYREIKDGIVYQRLGGGGGSLASATADKNVNFCHYFIDDSGVRIYTTHMYFKDEDVKGIEFCELPEKLPAGSKTPLIVHGLSGSQFKYYSLDVDAKITSGNGADIKDGMLHARRGGRVTVKAAYNKFETTKTVTIV